MLNECYKYSVAINAKGEPFPSEPLIMALLIIPTKNNQLVTMQTFEINKYNIVNTYY
jgi:hypothetical protein